MEGKSALPRDLSLSELEKYVNSGTRPSISDSVLEEVRDLISSCWDCDPTKRPTFNAIVDVLAGVDYCLWEDADSMAVLAYIASLDSYRLFTTP